MTDSNAPKKDALLSECGTYRHWLTRDWDDSLPRLMWIMLNPSTADASIDDPTIRRCISFSRGFGFGSLVVVNLFDLRATNPAELRRHRCPHSPVCDLHILAWAAKCDTRIAAWGNHGTLDRRVEVERILRDKPLYCLKKSKDGKPCHPLYLKSDSPMIIYKEAVK